MTEFAFSILISEFRKPPTFDEGESFSEGKLDGAPLAACYMWGGLLFLYTYSLFPSAEAVTIHILPF